ncbi:MAG: glycosyltransferase [Sphingobacteriales bacterium]|uniref:glycosyltransferase n=1 Tax=Hydrotalea flava TaxID=714549 RepID=UPI000835D823|nr:glycosyltransferase [Hydrotalea flava]RTL49087.1 MAG: glycosyltransferase [Sphingobacteriales bacterium]
MRIAFFVQYNHQVGTYFRWHNLAKALQQLGHEVDVYAGDHDWKARRRTEWSDGIFYTIIPALPTARLLYAPNDIFSAMRWLFHLPKKEYEVYHLYQPFLHAAVAWNYLRLFKRKAKFVYDWDDLWTGGLFLQPKGWREKYLMLVTKWLETRLPQQANGVTVCSSYLLQLLKPLNNVAIIKNGFWAKSLPQKTSLRKKWDLLDNTFYLGFIGKTADELDWVIGALLLLKEQTNLKVGLLIAGPPDSYVKPLLQQCKHQDSIRYLGNLSANDAVEVAAAIDLGLIPLADNAFNRSRFPVKFLDFLSVLTPVYVSDVGDVGQLARNLSGAFLGSSTKSNWITDIIPVVQQLTQGKQYLPDIEHLTPFSWQKIAEELVDFYQTLCKQIKQ